ncbi:MAG TPA: aminotransferase class V-fold PLP-dependent enzyme [Thermomicrobiaceae bacterium]|nr:aminotransferase class V-fold PLP-dependent enzyme [Thermomicrobiaceae bacterium]
MPSVDAIREMLPGVSETVYLNTGTCGPLPKLTHQAMRDELDHTLGKSRIDSNHFPHLGELRVSVREAVARVIRAEPSEVAVTSSTTDGMYVSIMGYRWQAGDELILSNIEHPGGMFPSFLAKRRYGVRIRVADIGLGGGDPADVVQAFERLVTPRTRMIVISHVSYTTGATLPVKEIVAMAHSHDVLVAVDAAQSYGALALDMHDLDVDFYACPGQKWMCGPDGTGALYVRAGSLGDLEQTFVSGGMLRESMDYLGGSVAPAFGAARFDTAGRNTILTAGQVASTRWIVDEVGIEWANQRGREIAGKAYDAIARVKGVSMVTPREALAGLIAFNLEGIAPPDLSHRLAEEHNVTIRFVNRYINNPDAARVSVGFYNNEDDIAKLIDGLEAIKKTL